MLIQWLLIIAVLCFDMVIVCDAISTVFLEQKSLSKVVSEYTLVDNIGFLPIADTFVVLLNVVGLCLVFWCYRRTPQHKTIHKVGLIVIALLMITVTSLNQINSYRIASAYHSL